MGETETVGRGLLCLRSGWRGMFAGGNHKSIYHEEESTMGRRELYLTLGLAAFLSTVIAPAVKAERAPAGAVELAEGSDFDGVVLRSEVPVLVQFYTAWCPPCREMSPILEELARENPGVKIVKVDVEENQPLSLRYKIVSVPTLILFQEGQILGELVGRASKSRIATLLGKALPSEASAAAAAEQEPKPGRTSKTADPPATQDTRILGAWRGSYNTGGVEYVNVLRFHADGTFTTSYFNANEERVLRYEGTYRHDAKVLTLNVPDNDPPRSQATLTWGNDDRFVLTRPGVQVLFDRVEG